MLRNKPSLLPAVCLSIWLKIEKNRLFHISTQSYYPARVKRRGIIGLVWLLLASYQSTSAQGTVLPTGSTEEVLINRLDILYGNPINLHSAIKPFTRGSAAALILHLDSLLLDTDTKTYADIQFIADNNNEWLGSKDSSGGVSENHTLLSTALHYPRYRKSKHTLIPGIYPTPASFLEINTPDFHLRLNPLFQFAYGVQRASDEPYFLNQRGIDLRTGIDNRVFLSAQIVENQAQWPEYVHQRLAQTGAIPGTGLVKRYTGYGVHKGFDFLLSQGFVGFNLTPHIGTQFGYGKNFIGDGYRSLLLSDAGFNYLHLKINWKVWKFHYQNLFAELNASSPNVIPDGVLVPKKYLAAHYLSYQFSPQLQAGIFEAVVLNRSNHFELQYLNPVIFYRAVEHAIGSPDNVLIGFQGHWNFLHHFQLYSQLMLDEFKFSELFSHSGWWANKYAFQTGLKYLNVLGINHFDLQAEYNLARPFTYSHYTQAEAYTHTLQPLAHPLGANFSELILRTRFQITPRLLMQARYIRALTGTDSPGTNWGGNILLPNDTRAQDYGHFIGQGNQTLLQIRGLSLSYTLASPLSFDLHYFHRTATTDTEAQTAAFWNAGVRMNLPFWIQDY